MIYSKFFRISKSNSFTTVIFNVLTDYGYEASKLCGPEIAAVQPAEVGAKSGRAGIRLVQQLSPPPLTVDLSPYLTRTATFGILSNLHRE